MKIIVVDEGKSCERRVETFLPWQFHQVVQFGRLDIMHTASFVLATTTTISMFL